MARVEGEDLDLETVQAQIDRSLAFADELASSWLKPSRSSIATNRTTEREFAELIRRPPRLGVGAPVPEVSAGANSRDVTRLKGRLMGNKKRQREDDQVPAPSVPLPPSAHDDDDEESRAGAIRKKQKIDPFALSTKKAKTKKKKEHEADGVAAVNTTANNTTQLSAINSTSPQKTREESPSPIASSSKALRAVTPPPPVVALPITDKGISVLAKATHIDHNEGDHTRVLYLDGPPPETEGDAPELDGSARKKRKRRKKKKKGQDEMAGTGTIAEEEVDKDSE